MSGRFLLAVIAAVAVVIGVQLHLAHQLSNMERQTQARLDMLADRKPPVIHVTPPPSVAPAVITNLANLGSRIDGVQARLATMIGHTANRRVQILHAVLALTGHKFILVLGDSITEASELPDQVCGMPLVNGGIGGARAATLIPTVEDVMSQKPQLAAVVLAIGVNDTQAAYWNGTKRERFERSYETLLSVLPSDTIIASLTEVDRTKTIGKRFSDEAWTAINSSILDAAKDREAVIANLNFPSPSTADGVHLTATSYPHWRQAIVDALKKRVGCL